MILRRWIWRIFFGLIGVLIIALLFGWWYVRSSLHESLLRLEGEISGCGVKCPVTVERDEHGVPTIRADHIEDVMFGLGFVHGQDRFFQMDLLRRNASGELAQIVGGAVLHTDRSNRLHRFRYRAEKLFQSFSPEVRTRLEKYAQGVNLALSKGLQKPDARPFEYHLLRVTPEPWKPEDSILTLYSMCLALQGDQQMQEMTRYSLRQCLHPMVAEFIDRDGTEWDAAIDDTPTVSPRIPEPRTLDFRDRKPRAVSMNPFVIVDDTPVMGSNNWAVSAKATGKKRAILANDMHLQLSMPNIWYRAQLQWKDAGQKERFACGVTLPGGPALVVGSNGHIAWGFTNTEGDWCDLIPLQINPKNTSEYMTPQGYKAFEEIEEKIASKDGKSEVLKIRETIWGPVIVQDRTGKSYAKRWVIYDPEGVNFGIAELMFAKNLDELLRAAQLSGGPHQNFVCADDQGRIAWTILGRIPRRVGLTGLLPVEGWATGKCTWDGFLKPEEYPQVFDPPSGRIWTANNRVVGGAMAVKIGRGAQDLGARAKQIRDDLLKKSDLTEADLLQVQLDDEAVFLMRWKEIFITVLKQHPHPDQPYWIEAERVLTAWNGHASSDSAGYPLVYDFRNTVSQCVLQPFFNAMDQTKGFKMTNPGNRQREGVVWDLLQAKPAHLLNPAYSSWDELLHDAAQRVLRGAQQRGATLKTQTWGKRNAARISHPLTLAVPMLSSWLNPPETPQPGAPTDMPRHAASLHGASQRIVVSPGKESEGFFHMPGGQSGHPSSPWYLDGHDDWVQGKPSPFLPGPSKFTWTLKP